MAKLTYSEVFLSLEGEGPHTGRTVNYLRGSRCGFTCAGFNNPLKEIDKDGYAPIDFNPKDYKTLADLPLITKGCDSQYSVNPKFSHLWFKKDVSEVVDEMVNLLPNQSWIYPSGMRVSASFTGGEPTVQWKAFAEILKEPKFQDCQHVIYETNCATPLHLDFIADINQWLSQDPKRVWTWSNSPKLTSSGEPRNKAIVPSIAVRQRMTFGHPAGNQSEQYFKFVCGNSADFDEVAEVMQLYWDADIPHDIPIYIMPQSCTIEQQNEIAQFVAEECIKRGYIFCYRVHSAVWGNVVGT